MYTNNYVTLVVIFNNKISHTITKYYVIVDTTLISKICNAKLWTTTYSCMYYILSILYMDENYAARKKWRKMTPTHPPTHAQSHTDIDRNGIIAFLNNKVAKILISNILLRWAATALLQLIWVGTFHLSYVTFYHCNNNSFRKTDNRVRIKEFETKESQNIMLIIVITLMI